MDIKQIIAKELTVQEKQIQAAMDLLDDGATVPFIARYRKEATGGLDDTQLRFLAERVQYLRELMERKATVLKSIEEQGKLNDALQAAIDACDNKTALEDLYLPYKPKRRTKAQIAREAGLEPLAQLLFRQPEKQPENEAQAFINAEQNFPDSKSVLDGARAILMEQFAEDADLIGALREKLWQIAHLQSQVLEGKENDGAKFKDYFDYDEAVSKMPSHRILAILRGRNEGILHLTLAYPAPENKSEKSLFEEMIAQRFGIEDKQRAADKWLNDSVRLAWRAKIFPSLELDTLNRLKEQADNDATAVFAKNLKDLLLAAPAGRLVTMGLDPGVRTGVKVAIVSDTGKLLETATIYPHQPRNDWQGALRELEKLVHQHKITLIAIGNGTASRETEKLVKELKHRLPENSLHSLVVSEAGASVYSASSLAAEEFPELDVSLRGAVSIARRLQDPLAELVKIDPKAIGVGQYQHDVNQIQLAKSLDAVVEDCVNAVGVDVNTASASLLARISGLNQTLAKNIVAYRDEHGAFANRKALLKVPRLGEKTFEQAAGFLRINGGDEPLDASAVHPEAYPLVAKMLAQHRSGSLNASDIIGNKTLIAQIKPNDYVDTQFGLPTILDILSELEKPGRDPRGEFKTADFADGIEDIQDLAVGMILEGVVSNVADFGAFVNIGVHQDGLVHISELANRYVANPREIVKTGDVVKVKVLEVDKTRKRIALSMRLNSDNKAFRQPEKRNNHPEKHPQNTAMAEALAKLRK